MSREPSWDIRGSYIAAYEPATKFFREWSVYTTHGGATILPEIRRTVGGQQRGALPIYGARRQDQLLATQILEHIAGLAKNDEADKTIITKLMPALIALCKYRPHFLLRLLPKGVAIEHIDVADEVGPARDALMARDADIRVVAPADFQLGSGQPLT